MPLLTTCDPLKEKYLLNYPQDDDQKYAEKLRSCLTCSKGVPIEGPPLLKDSNITQSQLKVIGPCVQLRPSLSSGF